MNKDNSNMDLDPEMAKQFFEAGAVLIITGVPRGTQFGIDLCAYTIADNFRGVKMIPPGAHFVWCASQGAYGDTAPRVGFVHFFKEREILIREWNNDTEELTQRKIKTEAAELECKRIRENLRDLDTFLAAYDYRYVSDWKQLTDTITAEAVERCRPSLGTIRTNIELQSCSDADRPRGVAFATKNVLYSNVDESELLPNLQPVEGTAPRFCHVPGRVPKNATLPAEISRHHMDCCASIDELFANFSNPLEFIEELQLSFIFYLCGYSIESLEHWRKALHLLAHSESAVNKYKLFFMKYSEMLAFQLPHLPEELMEPTAHNAVFKDVRCLLVNLHLGALNLNATQLARKLEKSMNWYFEGLLEDDPDDLPVFVETID